MPPFLKVNFWSLSFQFTNKNIVELLENMLLLASPFFSLCNIMCIHLSFESTVKNTLKVSLFSWVSYLNCIPLTYLNYRFFYIVIHVDVELTKYCSHSTICACKSIQYESVFFTIDSSFFLLWKNFHIADPSRFQLWMENIFLHKLFYFGIFFR